jgi:phosphate transport system substrate-binding protein
VFIGTLLGSLIGAAADFSGAIDTFRRIETLFYPELCVVGSNTILGEGITMAADWKAAFDASESARVSIDGIGSVRGVERAVDGGCVHVLAMSEPMTQAQYDSLTRANLRVDCAAEIGYDVIAFVTDIDNSLSVIQSRRLQSILTGSITNWSELGGDERPIHILARPGSGTTDFVLINVARYADPNLNDDVYFPPNTNYLSCESNEKCLDLTLSIPGSLYWVSTAWMRTQPEEYLRVMPILQGDERAINPLEDDVDLDEYPSSLVRPLYMYVLGGGQGSADSAALARAFLDYARSVRGQRVLEQHHFYTYFDRPRDVRTVLPPGFEPLPDGTRPVCRPPVQDAS